MPRAHLRLEVGAKRVAKPALASCARLQAASLAEVVVLAGALVHADVARLDGDSVPCYRSARTVVSPAAGGSILDFVNADVAYLPYLNKQRE